MFPDAAGTGTLTLRYKPVAYLVLSLEGRVEGAGEDVNFARSSPAVVVDPATMEVIAAPNAKTWWGLILGATVHIGN